MLNLPQLSVSPTLLPFTPLSTTFPPFLAPLSPQRPDGGRKKPRRDLRGAGTRSIIYWIIYWMLELDLLLGALPALFHPLH